jgi:hypothetical protein
MSKDKKDKEVKEVKQETGIERKQRIYEEAQKAKG